MGPSRWSASLILSYTRFFGRNIAARAGVGLDAEAQHLHDAASALQGCKACGGMLGWCYILGAPLVLS